MRHVANYPALSLNYLCSDARPLFEARREYLQAAFDTIDERYGSTDAYFDQGLGIDTATLERLRANLLE